MGGGAPCRVGLADVDPQPPSRTSVDPGIGSRDDPARWTVRPGVRPGVSGQRRAADFCGDGVNDERKGVVFGCARMEYRSGDDADQLRARLEALQEPYLAFGVSFARNRQRVAELRGAAARIRARSRAVRRTVLRVNLPRDPGCGAVGRRELEVYLDGLPDGVVSDAKTIASELINNAYRHGEGTIELRVRRGPSRIRIDVGDEGPTGAVRVRRSKGRRGLEIVDSLSLRWGAYAGSTHVWAELPITRSHPRAAGTHEREL